MNIIKKHYKYICFVATYIFIYIIYVYIATYIHIYVYIATYMYIYGHKIKELTKYIKTFSCKDFCKPKVTLKLYQSNEQKFNNLVFGL